MTALHIGQTRPAADRLLASARRRSVSGTIGAGTKSSAHLLELRAAMTTNGAFAPTTPRSVPNTAAAAIAASSAATFAGQAGPPGAAASHAGRGADAVTSLQPFAAMPASSAASGLSGIMRGLSGFSGMGAPDGVMPAGGTNAALILQGEITLDGRQLGRLTAKAQGRELARGQLGSRTVNLRKVAVPSGLLPPLP